MEKLKILLYVSLSLELSSHPAFRNHNRGDPTTRLYIKNLAKNVTEQVQSVKYNIILIMELMYSVGFNIYIRSIY